VVGDIPKAFTLAAARSGSGERPGEQS